MKSTSIKLVQALKDKGFTAYFAGGCVRDMLLNIHPKDFDIVTSAKPEEIEDIFDKTYPIGKEFGVILVHENNLTFEVATFRSDSGSSDGRRPDYVTFTDPKQDAMRRDFTINGMFYDPIEEKVFDFVGGQNDLEEKLIRFIGEPEERILEDYLRLIRAVRFKNTLQFRWNPDTYNALKKHANKAGNVSMERVHDELNKIIMSPYAKEAFWELHELGFLDEIMPELELLRGVAQPIKYHKEGDVFTHTMNTLTSLDEDASLILRWICLFHDIAKPQTYKEAERIRFDSHAEKSHEIAGRVMKRLRFSKKDIDHITWVTERHMNLNDLLIMPKGTRHKWFRNPYFIDLMGLFKADIAGTDPKDFSIFNDLNELYHNWLKERPEELPKLLSGEEIMEITGLKPGPELGQLKSKLEHEIHAHHIMTKEQAVDFIKNL